MEILVYIGATDEGFNTPAGSEQRYLIGIAEMLAFYGHSVDVAGSDSGGNLPPKWGTCVPVPNVTLLHVSQIPKNKYYDVAVVSENYMIWRENGVVKNTPCGNFDSIAKVVAHTLFEWAGAGVPCADGMARKESHWILAPWEQDHPQPAHAVVYYPVYKELAQVDLKTRGSVVWAMRNPFVDEYEKDEKVHFAGIKLLKAIEKLSKRLGIDSFFIETEVFKSNRSKRLGAYDIFNSIENKKCYGTRIRQDIINKALLNSRLNLVSYHFFSSAIVAPSLGAVPVYFKDDYTNTWPVKNRVLDFDASDGDFYKSIEKFFIDDNYYLENLNGVYKMIDKYSWESSYASFLGFVHKATEVNKP